MARAVAPPGVASAMFRYTFGLDVRSVLDSIQAPTLILHRTDYRFVNVEHGRYLAEHINGARLIELPGSDLWFFTPGSGHVPGIIEEFVTGVKPVPDRDRVLATVLFTDVVGSTEKVAALGDRPWNELLEAHDDLMRREVERFGGKLVGITGDEVLATFDGPGRAIRCARTAGDALRALGLDIRAGVHTGEIEARGDNVGGIAVHIGSRVMNEAVAGEVLCTARSRTSSPALVWSSRTAARTPSRACRTSGSSSPSPAPHRFTPHEPPAGHRGRERRRGANLTTRQIQIS